MKNINNHDIKEGSTLLNAQEVRQVLEVASEFITSPSLTLVETPFERKFRKFQQQMLMHAIPPALVMCLTAILAYHFESQPLQGAVLILAIICELLAIVMMGAGIVGSTPFLWRLHKTPYGPFLEIVKMSCQRDMPFLIELSTYGKKELEYVLVQYKQGRNGFEKRSGMIAGAIDKVGIFPALAGLVITIANLLKFSDSIPWGSFFGPLLLILYVQAIAAAQMIQKMDRVIAVIELSIQLKNNKLED